MYIQIYMCVYIYMHTHIYINTYIYTYTCTWYSGPCGVCSFVPDKGIFRVSLEWHSWQSNTRAIVDIRHVFHKSAHTLSVYLVHFERLETVREWKHLEWMVEGVRGKGHEVGLKTNTKCDDGDLNYTQRESWIRFLDQNAAKMYNVKIWSTDTKPSDFQVILQNGTHIPTTWVDSGPHTLTGWWRQYRFQKLPVLVRAGCCCWLSWKRDSFYQSSFFVTWRLYRFHPWQSSQQIPWFDDPWRVACQ